MGNTLKLNHHATSGKTPTNLAAGEVAINSTNKKIWVGTNGTTAGQVLVFDHSIYSTDLTDNNDNYYLTGITKSSNKLTFAVSGTSNVEYTFGSNAFTSTTIPTNTNELTNGAGFVTATILDLAITAVTVGTGLDGGATSGTANISLDLSELTDMTADVVGSSDELILLDSGAERRKAINEIKLSQFNNDSGFTSNTGTTTATNTQTFTNKSGNISQWTNDSGYTTNTGTTTATNTQTFTNKSGNISQWTNDSGYTTNTGTTTASNSQTFTNKSGNISQWTNDSGYITDGNTGWNNSYGFVTSSGVTQVDVGTGLDGGGSSSTVTVNLDLSALADMTEGWANSTDEFIVLDNGTQKKKLSSEIFGSNAFNSTTIPTNTNELTNGAGFITDGNTGWNNTYGFVTSSGVTSVASGTGLSGGTITGTGTLSLALGDLDDMTEAWSNDVDEFVVLDNGSQARKLSSEIFGSNAFNSTTIPTNNNQLTNGAGYTTNTGTTTANNSQTFTNKSGNISQWTNDSGYTTNTGTTTSDNTQTFTNKSGNISQWTNDSGYTTNTGTTTATNTQTFTNKSGNISQWTNDSGYTTNTGTVTEITTGTGLGGTIIESGELTLNLSDLPDMTAAWTDGSDEFIVLDSGTQKRKLSSEIFGSNAFNSTTIPTNTNQLTNGSSFITASQTTMNSTLFGGGASGVTNQGISKDIGYKLMNGTMSVGCVTTVGGTTNEYLRYGSGGTFTWDTIQFSHLQNLSALTALP